MTEQAARTQHFLELHHGSAPLLLPNAWDRGSAALLTALGFSAIATTSSGFAATQGRLDGSVTRDEALAHAAAIATSTHLPVSADLENCFADDPAGVAETVRLAAGAGLVLVRPIAVRHLKQPPSLRTGTAALVGRSALVQQEVNGHGGRVRIGGEEWSARSYDETLVIPVGATVDVIQIEGATALVYPRE